MPCSCRNVRSRTCKGRIAFILGCVPRWTASGSGAVARRVMGTTVISGMRAATFLAIFLIPVTYFMIERFAADRREIDGKKRSKRYPVIDPVNRAA